MDRLIRATAKDGMIRIIAADTTKLVREASLIHDLKPVGSALLGRMLTMGSIMGATLKSEENMLTLQMKGDGPSNGVLITANGKGEVKGYINNPEVDLPIRESDGKLDVGAAVGKEGALTVIIDQGLKDPYVSSSPLVSGEVAEDFAYYFAVSEQTPTAVNLGVLIDSDELVKVAAGYFIQLMPGADPLLGDLITYRLEEVPPLTTSLSEGKNIKDVINLLLDDMDIIYYDEKEPIWKCNCSREKIEKALISIGKSDLEEIYKEGKNETVNCHFCNTKYVFTPEDIKNLVDSAN